MPAPKCKWKQHDDVFMAGTWEGNCGVLWTLSEGTPEENEMNFCPRCGRVLVTVPPEVPAEEPEGP